MSRRWRILVLLLLTLVPATLATAQEPDARGRPGIGEEARTIVRELRRMGFPMVEVRAARGRARHWVGERVGATASLTSVRGRVTDLALEVEPVTALADDPITVQAAEAWQELFIPEAGPMLDGVIRRGSAQVGGHSVVTPILHDRVLRIDVAIGPTLVRFRVAELPTRFELRAMRTPQDLCRAPDPRTGTVPDELHVPVAATVEDHGGRRAQLWLVVYETSPVDRPVELRDLSWGPTGIVADPVSRTIVLPGPPIGRNETLELRWTMVLRAAEAHGLTIRFVEGPIPDPARLEAQAATVRDGLAFDVRGSSQSNEVCLPDPGEDPTLRMVREHVAAAVLALREIRSRSLAAEMPDARSTTDERLAPFTELRDWAVAERTWAEEHISGSLPWDHPSLQEWRTLTGTAGVLLTDVVATRIHDPDVAESALWIVDSVLDSVGGRVAQELAPPPDPGSPEASPRPVDLAGTARVARVGDR